MARGLGLLPVIAMAAGTSPAAADAKPTPITRDLYPVWVAIPPANTDETVTLQSRGYATLFTIRPLEAFAALDPVLAKKGKEVLPAGAIFMRAPGPDFIACEAVRKRGNERFTCLRDDNRDGVFDQISRTPTASDYFIYPMQAYPVKYTPLYQPVRYRDIDETTEFRPVEFIVRFSHLGKWGVVDFCFEPFRRKESWGFPHLVDACLADRLRPDFVDLPKSLSLHGFKVSALAVDDQAKTMTLRLQRQPDEYRITFGYADAPGK